MVPVLAFGGHRWVLGAWALHRVTPSSLKPRSGLSLPPGGCSRALPALPTHPQHLAFQFPTFFPWKTTSSL